MCLWVFASSTKNTKGHEGKKKYFVFLGALCGLSIEDTKGHDTVKDAAALLNASSLNYVGFIEGSELFSGKADVVVTDGFTGNVALKTMEGTVGLVRHYVKRGFTRNWLSRLQALLASSTLGRIARETVAPTNE